MKLVDVNKHFNKLFLHCLQASKIPSTFQLKLNSKTRRRKNKIHEH